MLKKKFLTALAVAAGVVTGLVIAKKLDEKPTEPTKEDYRDFCEAEDLEFSPEPKDKSAPEDEASEGVEFRPEMEDKSAPKVEVPDGDSQPGDMF